MRSFVNEVKTLQSTAVEGHIFDSKHLDPLGRLLVQATLRQYFWFDALTKELLEKPLPKKHRDLHLLIMIGLCAIDTLNQPQHTSVNATVETAKRLNKRWASSLTNATLRRYLRDRSDIQSRVVDPVAIHNHPIWMLDQFRVDLPKHYPAVILANNHPGPMTLRVNILRQSRAAYLDRLTRPGFMPSQAIYHPKDCNLKARSPFPSFLDLKTARSVFKTRVHNLQRSC